MMTYDELDAIRDDEHVDAYEPILYTVEEIAETDAGLATLVARYADARNYWLVAPITFFVSTASKPETGRDTTALVWDLVARLQTDNQSARVNVMTAIVMRTIAVEGLVAPPSLYPFLLRSLDLDPLVQSGVAQVFGDLYWQGSLEHWPREHIDTLRARLRALRDPAGDRLLQSELRDLDFLDD